MTKTALIAGMLIYPGMLLTKDGPEEALDKLKTDISSITELVTQQNKAMDDKFVELKAIADKKADDEETKALVKARADEYADIVKKTQDLTDALNDLKKDMDNPAFKSGGELKDRDEELNIELQRRTFLFKGGNEFDFVADITADNLVKSADYASAARKLAAFGGIETKEAIKRMFTDAEKKAFDAASLDSGFFMPEMLGIEIDCEIECAEMLDLYAQITVSKSNFMFPHVLDYGAIGQYDCDAKCDAELGPEGNITYKNGKTFDFRGVFCFQRKVLQEANYDLLGFMMRAAARSHRINRNRALITGDGVNEPLGWLKADCFTKISTTDLQFSHQDARRFIASAPVEYGPVIVTMHQNVFAYLAAALDANGRFIFGDGLLTYSPDDVRERIRISNCLPDATANGTRGNAASQFVAGDFLMAAGNWKSAYASVSKRPMWMEQYIGGSSAWCVKYQFGAEDGGFVMCCPAARILTVGP